MKLTLDGLKERQDWERAGIVLPAYDGADVARRTQNDPVWVHFGVGNIFRIFIGGIADQLISEGLLDKGITGVETFDYDVVDKIYRPFDNLVLSVTLHGDGTTERKVLASVTEAVKAQYSDQEQWGRLKEIFRASSLQMVSFTITEKGYALTKADGTYFEFVKADLENGPEKAVGAMAVVAAMLLERYRAGRGKLALVSMDNCSQNGQKFQNSVLEVAEEWKKRGFVDDGFLEYVHDERQVAFPWTMIDKITPRPSEKIAKELEEDGVEEMQPVITSGKTYIAPFVNAEGPQYLVVEDSFPNGRPALERAGVYMTDRDTVNKSEKMKVTACLNPIHTALGPYGCVLGYELFSDEMKDPDMLELARRVGYVEGMEVVPDPGILSPKAFLDEVINESFPNTYLGDTSQRLSVDVSQGIGIRFGETIKSYMAKFGDARRLNGIPIAIAGWFRYLLAVDEDGNPFELAPDPMIPELREQMAGIVFGNPSSLKDQLKGILSNENIFAVDLYRAGIGEKIEEIFREEIAGPGAVRRTVKKYLDC